MIRLRNVHTGALVSVRDEKAPRMGTEWEPVVDTTETPAPAPKRGRTKAAGRPAAKAE